MDQTKYERAASLTKIVEENETHFFESHEVAKKDLPRSARKRGWKAKTRALLKKYIPVLVLHDSSADAAVFVLEDGETKTIGRILATIVNPDNVLCTDRLFPPRE